MAWSLEAVAASFPLIAFAAFFGVGMLHLYVLDCVRVAISKRHPGVFQALKDRSRSRWFKSMAAVISTFVWKRQDKSLGDSRLTALARVSFAMSCLAFLTWLIFMVSIFTVM